MVPNKGTGQTVLTTYGVLIGEGSNNIHVTAAGTNGQLLIGTPADPVFSSLTSSLGSIQFTSGPGLLNIETAIPLSIGVGGTGATSFGITTSSLTYYDQAHNKLANIVSGNTGQILSSQGPGLPPQFISIATVGVNIADNFGNSVSSAFFKILGSTAPGFPIQTKFTGNSLFINMSTNPVTYGGTGQTSLTSFGVLIGEGNTKIHATAAGTNGQLLLGSPTDPVFGPLTSSGASIIVTAGPGTLNLEVNPSVFGFFQVSQGGTGRTVLTSFGVLIGEGANGVDVAAGTSGQVLIGSPTDPSFGFITSSLASLIITSAAGQINVDVATPIDISLGGTDTSSFGNTTSSLIYFDGDDDALAQHRIWDDRTIPPLQWDRRAS